MLISVLRFLPLFSKCHVKQVSRDRGIGARRSGQTDWTMNCGFVLLSLQLRQPIAAVKSLQRATVLLPNDIALMVELGNAQFQAQTYAAAINTLSEVLRFDPDNANALYLSAHANLSMGNLIKAKEYTLLLRSKHPNFQIDQRLSPFLTLPKPKQ